MSILIYCRDKIREKIRQEKLSIYRETGVWPTSKAGAAPNKKKEAWSEKKDQKNRRKEKRLVKMEQREKRNKKKRAAAIDDEDWDELARDARLLKKLKRGKVRRITLLCTLTSPLRFLSRECRLGIRLLYTLLLSVGLPSNPP